MGIIYSLGKLAAKYMAKSATKDINELAGVKAGSKYVWTLQDKIAELKTDHGLSADYVKGLIEQAQNPNQVEAIQSYLASVRNDLPNNVTIDLMKSSLTKLKDVQWQQHLAELKKQWLANHADQHVMVIVDHLKEMI